MLRGNKTFEDLLIKNKVDYISLISSSFCKLHNDDISYDINMIVPVKGREHFLKPLYESFLKASKKSKLKISLTIVEISEFSNQKKYCDINNINYIHIDSIIFNKCLAMNFGALFSVKSKSFLFHDLDCLLDNDFFNKLEQNIENKKLNVLQCFPDGKLFYLNEDITDSIISGKLRVDDLSPEIEGVSVDISESKSPGGSIYITRDIFFEVGGYDPEFFIEHSPEDSFFWEKIELLGENIGSCDDPRISLYHMNHERNENVESIYLYNTIIQPMIQLYRTFHYGEDDYKLDIILQKKDIIRDFYNYTRYVEGENSIVLTKKEDYYFNSVIPNRLERIIMDKYFKIVDDKFIAEDLNIKKERLEGKLNTEPISVRKSGIKISDFCSCGEIINKREFNFCQKCKKLYQ